MENKRYNIHTRILGVISIILFSTFLLIGIIFNFAARRYIQSNAIAQLNSYSNAIQEAMNLAETILLEFPSDFFYERTRTLSTIRNDFRIEPNMFVLDIEYNLIGNQITSDKSSEILDVLKAKNVDIDNMRNYMLHTINGTYYVSSYNLPIIHTDESAYWIIYADITGLSNFSRAINRFLIILFFFMFIVTVIIAYFFSNTITRPIRKLNTLALKIGKGDFTPQDYQFKDKEFEELNISLNKSAKQLSIYDNEQKTFFQNVSHELRTPLMSIQCYAEGISCGLMEPVKASETILDETTRLSEMIKDLLYISKIDNITSAYTVANADIFKIIEKCVGRQQAVADKKNIRFALAFSESAVYLNCVEELMSRAIENLISNAIRYAKSEISIFCSKIAGNIEICIKDDGAGIVPIIIPHIFERFYKGEDGNHGIGLSIVKSIIEQHGGNIKAENIDCGGAAFTITLPYKERVN